MTRVYVSVGSNIDRHINIYAGLNALRQRYGELTLSPIYETEAVGFEGDPFFNLVVVFETSEPPQAVHVFLKAVEDMQGRERPVEKFSPRTLDMDMLLYGDQLLNLPGLEIPRDEIFKYAFVLQPLTELAADKICPGTDKSFAQLWLDFQAGRELEEAKVVDWQPFYHLDMETVVDE